MGNLTAKDSLTGKVALASVTKNGVNNALYPRLSDKQKAQLQALIDQYMRVRNSLFCYVGSVRREGYAYTDCGSKTYNAYNTPKYPVLRKTDSSVGSAEYYKYMLNCGLFCQMIWMGRPVRDFLTGTTEAEQKLLGYAEGTASSSKTDALTQCPTITNKITSDFKNNDGSCWGYYFGFDLSKQSYGAVKSDGSLYSYNSYFKYDNSAINVELESVDLETHSSAKAYSHIRAVALINQVMVNAQFTLDVKKTIEVGTEIIIGKIVPQTDITGESRHYRPSFRSAIAVQNSNYMFDGCIATSGNISVRCDTKLEAGSYNIAINGVFIPKDEVYPNGEILPLGYDGAANMAEELHALGYEVPYSQIDIGDLVFFRDSDISDDFRNKLGSTDDDATINKAFRNIGHVGVVYDFDEDGYPIVADCTDAYSSPIVIGKTRIGSSENFSKAKASSERNYTVMVARHPAAFGAIDKDHQVPDYFKAYRGTLNDSDVWKGGEPV